MNEIKTHNYFVYIMTNITNNVMYIGVTNNIIRRVYEHKKELLEGFTKKYKVKKLIYYEIYNDINTAIEREKQLKKWNKNWKLRLIKKENKNLQDLYEYIIK